MSADNLIIIIYDTLGFFHKKKLLEEFLVDEHHIDKIEYIRCGELIIIDYSRYDEYDHLQESLAEEIEKWIYLSKIGNLNGDTKIQIFYNKEQGGVLYEQKFENTLAGCVDKFDKLKTEKEKELKRLNKDINYNNKKINSIKKELKGLKK